MSKAPFAELDTSDGAMWDPTGRLVFFRGRCVLCQDNEQAKLLSTELRASKEMLDALRECRAWIGDEYDARHITEKLVRLLKDQS